MNLAAFQHHDLVIASSATYVMWQQAHRLTIPQADEVMVRPRVQDEVPQTPSTPVSVESLMTLRASIINKYAPALDDAS